MRRLSLFAFSVLALLFLAAAHAITAGRTAGQFAVSPTGAATYTIPIWAPPGPKGMQPSISLVYNSQSGNGYVGVGWNLAGLSSIYRCNLTYAQDAVPAPIELSTSDGYCMDGQRLRLTSGTYGAAGSTYQTEIANFENVTAYGTAGNGPAYFIVQSPDGRTLQYGNGGNSQVLASGTSTALAWMLNEVSDPPGNTLTMSYSTATGTVVPNVISWTPTSHGASSYSYTMTFGYGTNVLPTAGYVGGTPVQNPNLLGSITIDYGGTQVKQYVLTYQQQSPITGSGRDVLTQVQECAASTSNCLDPTLISYQSGSAGVSTTETTAISSPLPSTFGAFSARYDFDGDGYTDLLYEVGTTWYVAFGSASGYGSPKNTGITGGTVGTNLLGADLLGTGKAGILANNGGTWYYYTWNGSAFVPSSTGLAYDTTAAQFALADINGDGLPDLVALYQSVGASVTTRLNTSSGGTPSFSSSVVTAATVPSASSVLITPDSQPGNLKYFDFDGDGRQDLVLTVYGCMEEYGGTCYQYGTWVLGLLASSGGTFTGFPLGTYPGNETLSLYATFANVNNDSCTDMIVHQTTIAISSCNGSWDTSLTSTYPIVAVMDWNGDGLADLVEESGGTMYVQLATATGFGAATAVSPSYASNCTYITLDANGDGLDDLGCLSTTSGTSGFTYYLHNGANTAPDLLTRVTDGFGNSASPTYASIVQSNYVAGAGTYPDVPHVAPIYVANAVTFSDPSSTSGGTYSKTYQYYGSQFNLQGRGWDGFAETRALDSRNALYDYRYFLTGFPYTGMQYEHSVSNGASTLSQSLGTQAVTNLSTTQYQQTYFPYFSNVTAKRWELGGTENGDLITTVSTQYTYDSYGNATTIAKTVTDDDPNSPYSGDTWTTTTTNTPDVSTGTWCLNLLTQTQVAYTASTGSAVTRTKEFSPDLTACRYTQIVTEPTSGAYKLTEALGYDSFGNVNNDSITGIGIGTARTTSASWGTTGQFPMSVTDPTGAQTQFNFNFSYGKVSSQTDPNNLTTSWQYGDGFGRKTQETRPDGTYTTWAYNDMTGAGYSFHGLLVDKSTYTSSEALIRNDDTGHDPVNRVVVQVNENLSGGYNQTNVTYDSLGRVASRSLPCTWTVWPTVCTYWTTTSYDVFNRPTQVQRPISSTNSTLETASYAYAGRATTVTDPNGHAKTTITDVNGLLREALDANGYAVVTSYDAAGSKTGISDNQSRQLWSGTVQYGIDPFTVSTTDSALGGRAYTFDALGEVTNYSDTNDHNFSATYDALSRMTSRTEPDLFTQWTWGSTAASDNIGQLASVCTGNSTTPGVTPTACTANSTTVPGYSESEFYDSAGRLSQRSIVIPSGGSGGGTFNYGYQYNSSGQLGTLTYPTTVGSPLQLQYNYSNGILQSIVDVVPDSVTLWTANASNADGQITQETVGNGVVINRSYDPVTQWLNSVTAGVNGGATLENQSYEYDEVGNVTQRQENNLGFTENFYYDNLNRLYYSQLNSVTNLQMCYDNSGGSCTENVAGPGSITSKTADAVAQSSYTATWTSYNYPSKIATASESVQFSYGPDRQRWQQNYNNGAEITNYIGQLLEQVVTTSGTGYRQYVYAGAEPIAVLAPSSSGNTVTYMLSDQEGSVAALLNSSGAADVNESFTAYGSRRNPATWSGAPSSSDLSTIAGLTRQGYTFQTALGQFMGFNHMNGRVQDAITGQFMSPDPNIPDPTNTQDYNRYAYVDNNPLSLIDPSGFDDNCGDLSDLVGCLQQQPGVAVCGPGGIPLDDFSGCIFPPLPLFGGVPFQPFGQFFPNGGNNSQTGGGSGGNATNTSPPPTAPPPPTDPPQTKVGTGVCSPGSRGFIAGFAGGAVGGGASLAEFGPIAAGVGAVIGGLTGGVLGLLAANSTGAAAGYGALGGPNTGLNAPVSGAIGGAAGGVIAYGLHAAGTPDSVSGVAGSTAGGAISGALAPSIEGIAGGTVAGAAEGGVIGAASGATAAAVAAALNAACGT